MTTIRRVLITLAAINVLAVASVMNKPDGLFWAFVIILFQFPVFIILGLAMRNMKERNKK